MSSESIKVPVSIGLPISILNEIDKILTVKNYPSRSNFVLEAVKEKLSSEKKEK